MSERGSFVFMESLTMVVCIRAADSSTLCNSKSLE